MKYLAVIIVLALVIISLILWGLTITNSYKQDELGVEATHQQLIQQVNSNIDQLTMGVGAVDKYAKQNTAHLNELKDMLIQGQSSSAIMSMMAANSVNIDQSLYNKLMDNMTMLVEKRDFIMFSLVDKIKARKVRLTATVTGSLLGDKFDPSKYDNWLPIEGDTPATEKAFKNIIQ